MIKNQILLGNCLEIMPQEINNESVDLVVTSPPYNVGMDYGDYDDNMPWDTYYNWCYIWLEEIYRILKKDGRFCLNHYLSLGKPDNRHSPLMDLNWIAVRKVGFKHHGLAIWNEKTLAKRTAWGSWLEASAPYINSPLEGVLILYKDQWKKRKKGETTISKKDFMMGTSGVWELSSGRRIKEEICSFPPALPALCINLLSYRGDLVLDPFNGWGNTTTQAKKFHRNFIGIELSPKRHQYSLQKIKQEVL